MISRADGFDPLPTFNQSPLIQIYGLPEPGAPRVLARGRWRVAAAFEVANNFLVRQSGGESLLLDGETHRTAITVKYGGGSSTEWGIEVPYITQSGGFLDNFIENWHDVFHLPQGNRNTTPTDQIRYVYQRDGVDRLNITSASRGVGDIRLLAGWQVTRGGASDAALHASLKLPTGDAAQLHGSGAADLALWLTATCAAAKCPDALRWNGFAGLLALGHGDVLPELQRSLVAFGGAGVGWRVWSPIVLKAELRAHSPFYRHTNLTVLNSTAIQLILGGTWIVDSNTGVDIGVSEDARVGTGPDVSLLVGLHSNF